ncbi:LppM family (lipo)protein [Acidipropionibacterium virtanenii]|uniref:LppM domain-containing protein n=1 Tax=Acidipropionibacterium virtanenii TaxID=2057246 RepID=A0A344UPZ5_9ACTN|nr:hypothetical protein [Acidipropionibacterium virtanenii]AXE37343.1 hypothetical protein JS278_00146 [Acidipropionibacterium virtanenii]
MDSTVDSLCAPSRTRRPRWRAAAAVLLAPLLLVLSACGNAEMAVTIKSADEVTIVTDFSMKSSETAGLITKDDLCDSLDDAKYYTAVTTESYQRDGMIGCRATATSTLQKLDDEGIVVRDGDKVTVKFTTSSVSSPTGSTDSLDSMKLSVTFPGKVLSHTGTGVVKDSTVTWSDPSDLSSSGGISATGTLAEGFGGLAWWIWAIIGVSAAAIIGAVIGVVIGRRRRARATAAAAAGQQQWAGADQYGQYTYGQQPPQQYGEQPQYPPQQYGQEPQQGPQGTQYLESPQQYYPQPPAQDQEQFFQPPASDNRPPGGYQQGGSGQPWGVPDQDPATRPMDWQDVQSTEAFSDRKAPWETPGWEDPGGQGRSHQ